MAQALTLSPSRFAAWARRVGARLPYPVDITNVDAAGAAGESADRAGAGHDVDDDDILRDLARICAGARMAVFAARVMPDPVAVVVAIADERDAALVTTGPDRIIIEPARADALVLTVADCMPRLRSWAGPATSIAEQSWHALLHRIATDPDSRGAVAAGERAGLPVQLARAMAATAREPVPIGLLGASAAAPGDAHELRLGPTMGSWYVHPEGAVLVALRQPRHSTSQGRFVQIEPYSREGVTRVLVDALGAAGRQAHPRQDRSSDRAPR